MMMRSTLDRLPANLPRYTSYPTAPHFSSTEASALSHQLVHAVATTDDLSVYVHIPFCDRLCWFCGCHTKQTLKYAPVESYISSVEREIELLSRYIKHKVHLSHLHLGGGSPSMLRENEFARLRSALETIVDFDSTTEVSVEIDPSDQTIDLLGGLKVLGVTRASIGVQDFDPDVQAAINRIQSFDQTHRTISILRSLGISSINIDALYGLPYQTTDRLLSTLRQVIELSPDRIALFGYAHVPWMKKHQTMIPEAALPSDAVRVQQAAAAAQYLVDAGYVRVGLDHFSKSGDGLAKAQRNGTLRRNFQGYTTDTSPVLLGLGASAISRFPGGLMQNTVATSLYQQGVQSGALPHAKGISLTSDDIVRGWIIERLMCDLRFSKAALMAAHGLQAETYWALAEETAASLPEHLCSIENEIFVVPEAARNFIRMVAAQFDAYLSSGPQRYSKAV